MKIVLYVLSFLAIGGTLLPSMRNKYWFIRNQAYFRAYYLSFHLIFLLLYSFFFDFDYLLGILSFFHVITAFISFRSIRPYLIWHKKRVPDSANDDSGIPLKILIYNVLLSNTNYQALLDLVEVDQPDAILLLEPGKAWDAGIEQLYQTYDSTIKELKENTYGIIFLSKIPFADGKVNHFVSEETPSIEVKVKVGGREIRIYGLHPKPPIPGEQKTSVPKDLELMLAARRVISHSDRDLDIMVGDLNDVGWSRISKKFREVAGLLDPRVGRGFFATFPTYLPLRIPIDHIFCSPGFSLISIHRHKNIGSDHFPVSVTFSIPSNISERA